MRRTAPPERWRLTMEALPQGRDASARLDRLLEAGRRIYGIKCVEREFVVRGDEQPTKTAERA